MRVTETMIFRSALAAVQRQRVRLAGFQEQSSTGLRINRPSDDPIGSAQASVLRDRIANADQLMRNQDRARERLAATENALTGSLELVQRARVLAVQGANDTQDATSRQAIAAEIEELHGELVSLSNKRLARGYVFAGYANDTAPFAATGPFAGGSPPPGVVFSGDAGEIEIQIDDGVRLPTTLNGQRVFLGDGDGNGSPDVGREDIFAVLGDLWQALDTNDGLAVSATLDRIDTAHLQLSLERTRLGAASARIRDLGAARESVENQRDRAADRLVAVESADAFEAFSALTQQEIALTAAVQVAARVIRPSLMDFLR